MNEKPGKPSSNADSQVGPTNRAGGRLLIVGKNLDKCEVTQFISIKISLWDSEGELLSDERIAEIYEEQGTQFSDRLGPCVTDVMDSGWGTPPDTWRAFTDKSKETIIDQHGIGGLLAPDDDGNLTARYYVLRDKSDMVIKVRRKSDKEVISEHKWGYVYQNFSGDSPKSPWESIEDSGRPGFYSHYGITGTMPSDRSEQEDDDEQK